MRDLVAPAEAIFLDAKFEAELVELDDPDEAREMLHELGVEEPGLDVLARVGFDTLGLQTYLTAGPKEARAWQIHKGDTAPEAAGVIHTDFQKGFIKAEIVSFDDLVEAGSMAAATRRGQGPHGGQGLRHGRRRRRRVPLQRVTGADSAMTALEIWLFRTRNLRSSIDFRRIQVTTATLHLLALHDRQAGTTFSTV